MFYVKHLHEIFRKSGADFRSYEDKKIIDRAVREVLEMEKADAEDVWKVVKPIILGDPGKKRDFEQKVVEKVVKYLVTGV